MNKLRLTPENVNNFIGYNIEFKTRKNGILVKKILGASKTGKTIYVEYPDVNNNLEIVSRKIYIINN